MAKYALSKWFARGHGHVVRLHGSDTLLFRWNGRSDGTARCLPDGRRHVRNNSEHPSLAALLRAIEAEHTDTN
jgi:hypothetical protein